MNFFFSSCLFFCLLNTESSAKIMLHIEWTGDVRFTGETVAAKEKKDSLSTSIATYYLFGEKYRPEKPAVSENFWIKNKLAEIEKSGNKKNLSDKTGGGPNDAEWNPSNDLLLVFTSSDSTLPALKVNGKILSQLTIQRYTKGSSQKKFIFYCKIAQPVWQKNLRKIKPTDLEPLFGKKKLAEIKSSSPAPPDTGEIVQFTFHQGSTTSMSTYFHCAFGE